MILSSSPILQISFQEINTHSNISIIYFLIGISYSIFTGILTLQWILAFHKRVGIPLSIKNKKKVNWYKFTIISCIGLQALILLFICFFSNDIEGNYYYFLITIVCIAIIYWVLFKSVTKKNRKTNSIVTLLQFLRNIKFRSQKIENIVNKQFMSSDEIHQVIRDMKNYIAKSSCYTNKNLIISDVSEAIDVHPKRLSHSLNKQLNINFNQFINEFRIEKSKILLKSTESHNTYSIQGISTKVGFNSKSSFYSAFKKKEGCTPSRYRKIFRENL